MFHASKVSVNSFHFLYHKTNQAQLSWQTYPTLCDPNHSGMELCEEFINEILLAMHMVFGIAILPTEHSAKLCYGKSYVHVLVNQNTQDIYKNQLNSHVPLS